MMSSVERIKYFTDDIPLEEADSSAAMDSGAEGTLPYLSVPPSVYLICLFHEANPNLNPTSNTPVADTWPSQGQIEARDVKMRYRDGPQVRINYPNPNPELYQLQHLTLPLTLRLTLPFNIRF